MSKARIHKIALIAVGGVVVLAAVAAVFGLVMRQGPLTGDMRHDFGEIWIEDLQAVREHTFTLVNESTRPVHVLRAIASCGCTAVKSGETIIEQTQNAQGVHIVPRVLASQVAPQLFLRLASRVSGCQQGMC